MITDLATAVVNRDVNDLIGPRRLPKLELAHGVPPDLATASSEELARRLDVDPSNGAQHSRELMRIIGDITDNIDTYMDRGVAMSKLG